MQSLIKEQFQELSVSHTRMSPGVPDTTMVSYRGPSAGGGVSSTLAVAAQTYGQTIRSWHFLDNDKIVSLSGKDRASRSLAQLQEGQRKSHYAFCNDFLWPVCHEQHDKVTNDKAAFLSYKRLNDAMSWAISASGAERFFVHDYQLAFLPELLKRRAPEHLVTVFWHIPWPESIAAASQRVMREVANSLARADRIGFHTNEYRENFLAFVNKRVGYYDKRKAVVAPISLDLSRWQTLARNAKAPDFELLKERKYVLSVDRADYTKGVAERLAAIREFFKLYPQWREKLVFVQVCGKTRPGLALFDNYWVRCRALAGSVNALYGTRDWQPILWITEPLGAAPLAALYREADAMLVNPIKDGLNLTAKEFFACQVKEPGALLLSPGAGVFEELGRFAIPVKPDNAIEMAHEINRSLVMPAAERLERSAGALAQLEENSLSTWWHRMGMGRQIIDGGNNNEQALSA